MLINILFLLFFQVSILEPTPIIGHSKDTIWLDTDSSLYQAYIPETSLLPDLLELADSCVLNSKDLKPIEKPYEEWKAMGQPVHIEKEQERTSNNNPTLLFYLLLIPLFLFILIRQLDGMYMRGLWEAFKNFNISSQFFTDHYYQNNWTHLLLTINAILVISTLIYMILIKWGIGQANDWLFWLNITGITAFILIGKKILLKMVSFILPLKEILNFHLFNSDLGLYMFSLILIPLLFIIAFAPAQFASIAIYLSFVILLVYVLYRVQRGIMTGGSIIAFHKFHFFVYLCTFEIAPLLILYKVIVPYLQ